MSKKGRRQAFEAFKQLAQQGTAAPPPDRLVELLEARRDAAGTHTTTDTEDESA